MSSAPILSTIENRVLSESVSSAPIALIRLGLEIDRQLRLLLAVSGSIRDYKVSSPPAAAALLKNWLTPDLIRSIEAFWQLRDLIVRSGESVHSPVVVSAIDSGLRILRTLVGIPRPKLMVRYPEIPFFTDQLCTDLRRDVRGVVLEWIDPIDRGGETTWYPTRKTYTAGESVSWEWLPPGSSGLQGAAWYSDPQSGNPQPVALEFRMEFIGRDLDTI